ncbi:MAG: protein-S-isoprenylcysteine O-methyltransferase [Rhizobiaceae bacterium]
MTVLTGQIAWIILVVGWYAIRYPFERRAKQSRTEKSARNASEWTRMWISGTGLGIIPIVYLATGWPAFANYVPSFVQTGAGIITAIAALWMFRATHVALGRFWSVSLDIRDGHKLVTDGIYAKLRHPMYSAFWLMALAQALLLPNWIAGLSGLVGFAYLFFLRIGPEEKMMEDTFGADYVKYKNKTDRIIPGVW